MGREPIIHGQFGANGGSDGNDEPSRQGFDSDDSRYDEELRPQCFDEIVGQRKVVDRLKIMLDATQKRNESLGHVLLDGPPGLGKTTFATVLPKELGVDCQITSGPILNAPGDLVSYLSNASQGSVLFIDEIHRLPPSVEEFLYPAMEDFRIDIILGEGINARTINMHLKPFTIVGATTRTGMLTAPLRDRFVTHLHLDFYEAIELAEIVTRNARKLQTDIDEKSTIEIAQRSRGTPRKANNLLRWVRDYATVKSHGHITHSVTIRALEMLEVDELGLEEQDRRYLMTLIAVFSGGPAGITAIAHSMSVPPDTLEDEVEPFLLRCGFVQRSPRGRMVTAAAFEHLKINPPKSDNSGQAHLF